MGKFSFMDIMNEISTENAGKGEMVEKVSVFDMEPNNNNFYSMGEIEQLKAGIFALGGVQQNLVLVENPKGSSYKYKVLSGHRRRIASIGLVEEGYKEYEFVPAVVKNNMDSDNEAAVLLLTNSTQRNLSDYEKVMQHMKLKEIIPKLKKRKGIDGRVREIEADFLEVSEGQVSIYNTIGTKLSKDLMDLFQKNVIGISIAYEAAKCDKNCQENIVQVLSEKGKITEDDIRLIVDKWAMEGQLTITDISAEPAAQKAINGSVTDSATLEAEPEGKPEAEEKKNEVIWLRPCKEEFEKAIKAIFEKSPVNTFPKDKMDEILNKYKEGSSNDIGQQLIFERLLPFENDKVQVIHQCGYTVKYLRKNEAIHIPIYYFWKTFREYYKIAENQNTKVETDTTEISGNADNSKTLTVSNVTESATSNKYIFRGGYEVEQVNVLIQQYEQYYNISLMNNDKNKYKYACLLDALEILKTNMEQQAKKTAGKE